MSEATFDKVAKIYDDVIPCHIRDHYLNKRLDFIKRISINGCLILDVGCGTGILDFNLEKYGFKIVSLDISREMLSEALKRGYLKGICSTATSLPFKAGSFDMVISIVTLHHLAQPQVIYEALKEMARVLKNKGTLLIWDHNPLNPYWPIFMKRLPQDKGVKRTIPLKEITKDLQDMGVSKITLKRLGFMPDFIPIFLLKPFKILEKIFEVLPLLNKLCAHNVIIAKKVK